LKKSIKDTIFSDSEQISTLKGCFFIFITQLVLLVFTIAYIFLSFNTSGILQSFAIGGVITNLGYHVVALFNGLDDFGEYAALKGVLIWYAFSILTLTFIIELAF